MTSYWSDSSTSQQRAWTLILGINVDWPDQPIICTDMVSRRQKKKKRSNIRNNISEIIRRRLLGWGFKSSVEMPGDVVALSFSITYMGGIESEIDESWSIYRSPIEFDRSLTVEISKLISQNYTPEYIYFFPDSRNQSTRHNTIPFRGLMSRNRIYSVSRSIGYNPVF